ncbi:MAG: hypothetical protein ACYC6F_02900 [Longimicrobiales bacterium]
MTDRRFTDKEVALILRRASDLETRSPRSGASARGLTLKDLEEIASEVGIDPALVVRAVAELEGPRGLGSSSLVVGPGPVRREVRAVPRELSREELAELMRVVEIEVEDQGTVTEALGSVRWTSKGRFLSTQVSFEPSRGETLMRVEERYSQALRGILHGIPASYGAIFGLAWALEGLSLGAGGGSIVALVSASLGWGLGSGVWQVISSRSRSRVQKLAEKLGLKAQEIASDDQPGRLPSG